MRPSEMLDLLHKVKCPTENKTYDRNPGTKDPYINIVFRVLSTTTTISEN